MLTIHTMRHTMGFRTHFNEYQQDITQQSSDPLRTIEPTEVVTFAVLPLQGKMRVLWTVAEAL